MAEEMENARLNYRNSKLFSHAFLEEHLPNLPEWQIPEDELKAAKEKLRSLCQQALPTTSEAALEEELIRPILGEMLGFSYLVQPSAAVFKTHRQPDYALFAGEEEKQGAKAFDGDKRLFESALAVADAKAWDVDLDAVGPASQMHDYVLISGLRWGILTNGRRWRLTHRDTVHELDTFFEIDVEELLKADDPTPLKYFLVFFHAESFQPGGFLDHVLTQSVEYAQRVGAELKENVYEALRCLCQGFLGGNAELSPEDLIAIHQNALIVLYRILFLLYAESEPERELLPLSNAEYKEQIGLCAVKRKVSEQSDWLEEKRALWTELRDLFRLINQGSEPLGICAYNGGLFDPQLHPLLERRQIGDRYLAEAVKLLACTDVEGRRGFLDYSALDVRELGSIYEGLLEHKLIRKDGELEWEKDRSQRKKTGSYYTPEYIVQYIVKQTIGPLIDEIQSGLETDLDELTEKIRHARGENRTLLERQRDSLFKKARERVLDLKILDPAMGSGHFLVSACDYVARRIAEVEADLAGKETEEAVQALKRTVAERCLYGVDLNPLATELAKLSLWLHTVAKGKPLSFLNHHLRTGNSLIGARVKDLERPPSGKAHEIGLWESKLVQDLAKAIGYLNFIKTSASASRSDIEEKKQRWELVNAWIGKYKQAADVWLSSHFDNSVSDDAFHKILEAAASGTMDGISDSPVFRQAQKIAAEKHFFHWELEFPDVFFDKYGRWLEKPGFDAVIGNPPYVRQEGLGEAKPFFQTQYSAFHGVADLYAYFIERGLTMLRIRGQFGFIVSNKFMRANYGGPLRQQLTTQSRLHQIVDFGELPVFPGAATFPAIVLFEKGMPEKGQEVTVARIKTLDFDNLESEVKRSAYPVTDNGLAPEGWSLAEERLTDLLRRTEQVSIPLHECVKEEMYRGIITGLNEAFFIDQTTYDRLIATDPASSELIKPLIVGDDVRRNEIEDRRRHLIVAPDRWTQKRCGRTDETAAWRWFSSTYPALARHLAPFAERARKRWDKGEFWWELRPCDYYQVLEQPKIVYPDIAKEARFSLDLTGSYPSNTIYIIPRLDYFLLAMLNAHLLFFFMQQKSSALGDPEARGRLRFFGQYMEQLPIRRIRFVTSKDERARLVEEGKRLYFTALAKLGLEADNQSTNDTPPTKNQSAGGGVG